MAPEREEGQIGTEAVSGARENVPAGALGRPLLIAAIVAGGVGAAVGTKALLDSRRKRGAEDDDSDQDLQTVLRHAALDVAIAATGEAADRLAGGTSGSHNKQARPQRS